MFINSVTEADLGRGEEEAFSGGGYPGTPPQGTTFGGPYPEAPSRKSCIRLRVTQVSTVSPPSEQRQSKVFALTKLKAQNDKVASQTFKLLTSTR